jgi:uncharacterized protein (TIGR03086 family)
MHVLDAIGLANTEFRTRLGRVTVDDWSRATPCDAWDVRALVNHVIGGNRRYAMLLRGASSADVDATRSADHLGPDPAAAFDTTAAELRSVFGEAGAMSRVAHHPAGDRTGAALAEMRVLDVSLHAWDLGEAIASGGELDPELVEFVLTCVSHIDTLGPLGYFATPAAGLRSPDGSALDALLHLAGRL